MSMKTVPDSYESWITKRVVAMMLLGCTPLDLLHSKNNQLPSQALSWLTLFCLLHREINHSIYENWLYQPKLTSLRGALLPFNLPLFKASVFHNRLPHTLLNLFLDQPAFHSGPVSFWWQPRTLPHSAKHPMPHLNSFLNLSYIPIRLHSGNKFNKCDAALSWTKVAVGHLT